MLDPKILRNDTLQVAQKLKRRQFDLDVEELSQLEDQRKTLQVKTQDLQSLRNNSAKSIGKAKAMGEDTAPLLAAVADLGDKLKAAEEELQAVQVQVDDIVMGIPNLPQDSVPLGMDENDNQEVRRWGEPRQMDFAVKDHVDLGADLGGMDFETAVREQIPIIAIVMNNGTLGMFKGINPIASEKFNLDKLSGNYSMLAEALGGYSERVEKPDDIVPAVQRAKAANDDGKAVLLEIMTQEELAMSHLFRLNKPPGKS